VFGQRPVNVFVIFSVRHGRNFFAPPLIVFAPPLIVFAPPQKSHTPPLGKVSMIDQSENLTFLVA
jgi:hypothetical protein